jgi:hypothetical protein
MSSPWLIAVAATALLVAGCDTGDGRELLAPPPGATAPPMPTSSTATTEGAVIGTPPVGSGEEAGALVLTSPAFVDGATIPERHAACGGADIAPALSWTGVPPETVELALTVVDPDAPGAPFVHHIVAGIDPVVTGIGEGGVPESAVEVQPWTGPCPPPGETHDYVFTLYALTAPSGIDADSTVEQAQSALESTPGLTATLTGTYGVPG